MGGTREVLAAVLVAEGPLQAGPCARQVQTGLLHRAVRVGVKFRVRVRVKVGLRVRARGR